MSGSHIAYVALQLPICLPDCYARSPVVTQSRGAYVAIKRIISPRTATRCPVPTQRMVLRAVRYRPCVWRCAKSGTDLVYGATQCPVLT
eukprot:1237690-Rhodomonas_salina.1